METVINFTPTQTFFFLALNAWIFVIFPVIVIKKLNYLTDILESQYYQQDSEDQDNQSGTTT